MISVGKKLTVYGMWAAIWPLTIYYIYMNTPYSIFEYKTDILLFVILASIVAFFPLLMGDHPVFLTNGVSFAAFLYFGLIVEIIVIQISLFSLLLKIGIGRKELFRIPLNMLMFLAISIISASLYFLLGGDHGSEAIDEGNDILPVLTYLFVQIIANHFFLLMIGRYIYGKKQKLFDQGIKWELVTTLLIAPVGLILYFVYSQTGSAAVYLIGFPFLLISIMLRQYHKTSQLNDYLKKTGDIGHELTGSLSVKEVLDVFAKRLTMLLPIDYMYVFDVTDKQVLKLIRFYDRRSDSKLRELNGASKESLSEDTLRQGTGKHFHQRKKWKPLVDDLTPEDAESVLSVPVYRRNEIVGVITVYSSKHRAFFKYQYMIVNILGSYLAVAIENARYYEKKKDESERCPLTSLYNYRYFENYLHTLAQNKKEAVQPVSQILLDIDYFKSVNDYYGHKTGNEILCELGARIEALIGDRGVAARYGGEEFAVLLPGMASVEALHVAGKIKSAINQSPFTSWKHILNDPQPKCIPITVSMGVASYPEHCDDLLELTRHADRAMYVGAKQQGRDKVASYDLLTQAAER
ncbi:sensor domain-containing diguanylate cyclase [Halobacillus sp. Marseille-Q1614]|uniref:sensor domain-containing diguanylate cyclase n=1 Tax=Halobacillus sp. Marseille-Q1614 TaxID=2709134 RepID=UPI00156F108D|nr:sensor domain-containing diguanylate cyclase [Halobacillus sp. Marseille-Q1614]